MMNSTTTIHSVTQPARAVSLLDHAFWRASLLLAWREIVRFLRQRNRVIGAVGQPILFWLLFGAGMNQTFQVPGQAFRDYFVPGTLVLILLFTAIFATISIIEDRQEGFLQAVLVAPMPRGALVLGKLLGGSVLAVGQSLLFLGISLLFRENWSSSLVAMTLLSVVLMFLIAMGLTALGFCLAWRLDSTQGFHAIMNLLLMPMWLLSGAFFPVPSWSGGTFGERLLHAAMRCNPVTYAVAGMRHLLNPVELPHSSLWLPSPLWCWFITGLFAVMMGLVAAAMARRPATGDFR